MKPLFVVLDELYDGYYSVDVKQFKSIQDAKDYQQSILLKYMDNDNVTIEQLLEDRVFIDNIEERKWREISILYAPYFEDYPLYAVLNCCCFDDCDCEISYYTSKEPAINKLSEHFIKNIEFLGSCNIEYYEPETSNGFLISSSEGDYYFTGRIIKLIE